MISDPRHDPFALKRALDRIPPTQEGIAMLQQELNNPAYKDMQFLILAKMNEISSMMDSAKGMQAQSPQGTIRDKIEQRAALAQTQAAQQAGAPQAIPAPDMQGESEAQYAHGGIAGQPVDPRMFQFANGGIIAFNGEKRSDVKDDEPTAEEIEKAKRPATFDLNRFLGTRYGEKRPPVPMGSFLEFLSPSEYPIDRARAAAADDVTPVSQSRVVSQVPPGGPQLPQGIAGARRGPQELAPVPPRPAVQAQPRPPVAAAPAAAAPSAAITPAGITSLAGALAPTADYGPMREAYEKAKPREFSMDEEIRQREELNKRLGIGSYATAAEKNIAELRRQFEASRPGKEQALMEWLGGISRKGAGAGEAGERVSQFQQRERDATFAFAQAEFKLKDALEKEREAARVGDRDAILATKKERETAQQNYLNKKVELEATILGTEEKRKAAGLTAATQISTEQMRIDAQSREKALDREIERLKINAQHAANELSKKDLDFRQTSGLLNAVNRDRARAIEAIQKRVADKLAMIDMQLQGMTDEKKKKQLNAEKERLQLEVQKEIDEVTKPFDAAIDRLEGRLYGSDGGGAGNWSVKKKTQ